MVTIGKQGASPNPIQRYVIAKPVLEYRLFVVLFCTPVFVIGSLVGTLLGGALFALGTALLLCLALLFVERPQLSKEEAWHTRVTYLPWPRSWPGWRDAAKLLHQEESRRGRAANPDQVFCAPEDEGDECD